MIKELICSYCDKNCILIAKKENDTIIVSGNKCDEGIEAAKNHLMSKKEVLSTLVRIKGSKDINVVPVKTTGPIDKSIWIECSKALSRLYVGAPIKVGDIVCKNLLNTGVDVVCTKNIDRKI